MCLKQIPFFILSDLGALKIFLGQILFPGVAERAYAMWAWSAILTTPVVTGLGV